MAYFAYFILTDSSILEYSISIHLFNVNKINDFLSKKPVFFWIGKIKD